MNYDPYSGKQIQFERTDRTGRHCPIHTEHEIDHALLCLLGGAVFGVFLALIFFLFFWI